MSALAIILAAAMAVPADGTKKVSAEMEQRLRLNEDGDGVFQNDARAILPASLRKSQLTVTRPEERITIHVVFTDEGRGKLRMTGTATRLGIYKREKDRLIICIGEERPTSYQGGDGQELIILHPVRSSK